jgi:23S rRNA (cytidine1920-2'-O)/16S rRNA (cytidine1409-2'-O)-methyltransferase
VGPPRSRLDLLLVERGLVAARPRARALIMAGCVRVDGAVVNKPGAAVAADAAVELLSADHPYVSRGGVKLAAALAAYGLEVGGWACLDVGASTGGFTDCLLQHGARRVYAVDVGYGQLAWRLRQDPRVVAIERANIRYLPRSALPEPVDLATIDASFISLKIVVPAVLKFLGAGGRVLALIKPQFEVGRGEVGKGGVVRDPRLHAEVTAALERHFETLGLRSSGIVPSPLPGPKGNAEFFILIALPN